MHLAQLNVGRVLHPVDHPAIRPFMDGLDHINRLAESSPGFIWRLQTESGNATDVRHPWSANPFALVNMSVWTSPAALKVYVYSSGHREYLARRGMCREAEAGALCVVVGAEKPRSQSRRGRRAPGALPPARPHAIRILVRRAVPGAGAGYGFFSTSVASALKRLKSNFFTRVFSCMPFTITRRFMCGSFAVCIHSPSPMGDCSILITVPF